MGKLAEIIESGQPPGYAGIARDPGSPQVAIPRALRRLEDEAGSQSKEFLTRHAQYSPKKLREIWIDGRKKRKHKPKPE